MGQRPHCLGKMGDMREAPQGHLTRWCQSQKPRLFGSQSGCVVRALWPQEPARHEKLQLHPTSTPASSKSPELNQE